jgi:hypothetical protein
MNWQAFEAIATVVMALIAGISAAWAFQEYRSRKRAETATQKAELELKQIRRRGDAPFLKPSDLRFNALYVGATNNEIRFFPAGEPSMLCAFREEVELEDGRSVIFVVENVGKAAPSVSLKLDGEAISVQREADMDHAHGLQFLVYPYHKSKHGKEQILTLSFESASGVQDSHRYLTRHGFRVLHRIDPPTP